MAIPLGLAFQPFMSNPLDLRAVGAGYTGITAEYDGLLRWDTTLNEFIVKHPTYGWMPLKRHLTGEVLPVGRSIMFSGAAWEALGRTTGYLDISFTNHGFQGGEVVTYTDEETNYEFQNTLVSGERYQIGLGSGNTTNSFKILTLDGEEIPFSSSMDLSSTSSHILTVYIDPVNYFITGYTPSSHYLLDTSGGGTTNVPVVTTSSIQAAGGITEFSGQEWDEATSEFVTAVQFSGQAWDDATSEFTFLWDLIRGVTQGADPALANTDPLEYPVYPEGTVTNLFLQTYFGHVKLSNNLSNTTSYPYPMYIFLQAFTDIGYSFKDPITNYGTHGSAPSIIDGIHGTYHSMKNLHTRAFGQTITMAYGEYRVNDAYGAPFLYTMQDLHRAAWAAYIDIHGGYLRVPSWDGGTDRNGLQIASRLNTLEGTSDDRLKHNEEPLDDALSLIRQLDVQTYDQTETPLDADFNGDLSDIAHRRRHGVIAQELELVAPHLVHERSDGIKTVDYFSLVGQCLRAIQQLDERVQALTAQLEAQ